MLPEGGYARQVCKTSAMGRAFTFAYLAGKPEPGQAHVQEHLWTGHKATDLHMPPCPRRSEAIAAHQQQIQRDASKSQWATTSHTTASQGASGGACKRQGCRYGSLCIMPA